MTPFGGRWELARHKAEEPVESRVEDNSDELAKRGM